MSKSTFIEKPSARHAVSDPGAQTRAQLRTGLITMTLAVVQTVLIAWFGFALSGRIELALKERAMTVQSANALASVIADMQSTEHPTSDQAAYVRKIAMYGSEAVEPLTIMAAARGPYAETVPLEGLKLVAVHHHEEACRSLENVVAARHLVDPLRFESIAKLHKELRCS